MALRPTTVQNQEMGVYMKVANQEEEEEESTRQCSVNDWKYT